LPATSPVIICSWFAQRNTLLLTWMLRCWSGGLRYRSNWDCRIPQMETTGCAWEVLRFYCRYRSWCGSGIPLFGSSHPCTARWGNSRGICIPRPMVKLARLVHSLIIPVMHVLAGLPVCSARACKHGRGHERAVYRGRARHGFQTGLLISFALPLGQSSVKLSIRFSVGGLFSGRLLSK